MMKVNVLNKLLLEEGWQVTEARGGHHLLKHTIKCDATYFITPLSGSEHIPIGTLNSTLRSAYQKTPVSQWLTSVCRIETITLILEKNGNVLWGRIETPGLLIITRGCNADCISDKVRNLLIDFATDEGADHRSILETIPLTPVYDMTAVWDLIRQVKANHLAGQAEIDVELIGQFMTGKKFPCAEQATRLENSIRQLGHQLSQVSIR